MYQGVVCYNTCLLVKVGYRTLSPSEARALKRSRHSTQIISQLDRTQIIRYFQFSLTARWLLCCLNQTLWRKRSNCHRRPLLLSLMKKTRLWSRLSCTSGHYHSKITNPDGRRRTPPLTFSKIRAGQSNTRKSLHQSLNRDQSSWLAVVWYLPPLTERIWACHEAVVVT